LAFPLACFQKTSYRALFCGDQKRDINPQNSLVGRGQFRNMIYLIDSDMLARTTTIGRMNTKSTRTTRQKHAIYLYKQAETRNLPAQPGRNMQYTRINTQSTGTNM
jgi:hypothetical protein